MKRRSCIESTVKDRKAKGENLFEKSCPDRAHVICDNLSYSNKEGVDSSFIEKQAFKIVSKQIRDALNSSR